MKDSFTCYLDLTHINDELEDVECEAELELYEGSNDSDDPSEIEVLSVKCIDESCPALFGQEIKTNQELEERICERYISHVSGS